MTKLTHGSFKLILYHITINGIFKEAVITLRLTLFFLLRNFKWWWPWRIFPEITVFQDFSNDISFLVSMGFN